MTHIRKLSRRLKRYGLKRNLASLKWQAELPPSTPLFRRLRLLEGGFTATSAATYALDRNGTRDYLSDLASGSDRARRSNGAFAVSLFSDKLLSHAMMRPHINVPDLLAVIEQGQVFSLEKGVVTGAESLLEHCEVAGPVILKPSRGMKGGGIFRLEVGGGTSQINGRVAQRKAIRELLSRLDDYLIEACVVQAGYAADVFSGSANTLRIVTMRDIDMEHKPFIAAAIHKFGTADTAPMDNWTRGGLSAPIDLRTGTLGPAVRSAQRPKSELV